MLAADEPVGFIPAQDAPKPLPLRAVRFAIVFLLVVAIGGPLVALLWWAIAAKVAPYEDEQRRAERKQREDEAQIVRDFSGPARSPGPPSGE